MESKQCVKSYTLIAYLKLLFIFTGMLIICANIASAGCITKSSRYSALVLDSTTGRVLYSKNANDKRYPASLTKLMTLYLTFEALERGKITMDQKIPTSLRATQQSRFKLGLRPGEKISIRDCIYSLITLSANDISVVLAEAIGGSEHNFAKLMTQKAKSLGMKNTRFINSHGCHDPKQVSTAADMAKLALAIKKRFPKYYPLFSKTSFVYKGKTIHGHNHVTKRYEGAEGLKTGYIRAAGFNLVTTANRPYGHVVGVVFGGPTAKARDDHMINILDLGFCQLAQSKGIQNSKCKTLLTPYMVAENSHIRKVNPIEPNKDIFDLVDDKNAVIAANLDTDKFQAHSKNKATLQKTALPVRKTKSANKAKISNNRQK
jgi:D-alanyl-D-alanine carboxypeptidase